MTEEDRQLRDIIFGPSGKAASERRNVDYKGILPWPSDKPAKAELVKDIVAMANWEGGWLVWGVTDALDAVGVSRETAASFDSTVINQFVNKYVEPPITTTVFRPIYDEKCFVVVQIPVFPEIPHLFVSSYPEIWRQADLFMRSATNSSERVSSSDDFRRILDRAVRLRADWLLSQIRGLLTTPVQAPIDLNPWYLERLQEMEGNHDRIFSEFSQAGVGDANQPRFVVTAFLAEASARIPHESLRNACRDSAIYHDGSPFFFPDHGAEHRSWGLIGKLERNYSPNPPWPTVDVWQLDGRGLFMHAQICGSADLPRRIIDSQLLRKVSLAVETASLLLSKLSDPSKPMTIRLELQNAEDLALVTDEWPSVSSNVCRESVVSWEQYSSVQEAKTGASDHAFHAFKAIRGAFGPGSLSDSEVKDCIRDLLASRR